jgi:hypothetical protein
MRFPPYAAWFFAAVVTLPAPTAGASVEVVHSRDAITISNEAISATWTVKGVALRLQVLKNNFTGASLPVDRDSFELLPAEGAVLRSSDFKIVGGPFVEEIPLPRTSSRAADHVQGRQLRLELEDPASKLEVTWKALLREGGNFVRQELTLRARQPLSLARINLIDVSAPGAVLSGHAKGSPVTAGNWFFGFEHPLSECRVRGDRALCWLSRELPLQPGKRVTYSSVVGVSHPGQLRRAFLHYLELERAHPYRTFLHYNTWYDLGYFERYSERDVLNSLQIFGEQLNKKRGVKLDGLLLDDGWDDPTTLWHFNSGFPDGLTNIAQVAAEYGAAPGIWLSPWGGYDKPKQQRLASAQAQGFETNEGGLALSGPKYYSYFRDRCLEMIEKYGVNQFKFDGTGNANQVIAGSEFDSDFDAAIHLIGELRAKKPDLFVNLTTGTYPSPFWLLYADSIWRGGDDHNFAGVGSDRQRWITYRDAQSYRWVVEEGSLFPLNSLMLHGMIYARDAERLSTDPQHDFADEVHSYFGTGTQLQEMYITPSLLSSDDWDVLAEAAKWTRSNANVLKDTHWIGGDPALLEVYGWAAWSPEKSIITLRNPSDRAQDFNAKLAAILGFPGGAVSQFRVTSPWTNSVPISSEMSSQAEVTFHLKAFEVRTMELVPTK